MIDTLTDSSSLRFATGVKIPEPKSQTDIPIPASAEPTIPTAQPKTDQPISALTEPPDSPVQPKADKPQPTPAEPSIPVVQPKTDISEPVPAEPTSPTAQPKVDIREAPVKDPRNLTELEWKAVSTLADLEENEDALPILSLWGAALESGSNALEVVKVALNEIRGIELVSEVAGSNFNKQANLLLIAAGEMFKTGQATVSVFGQIRTFHDIREIEALLGRIKADFDSVVRMPRTYAAFEAEGLPIIDKYLFDGRNLEAVKDDKVKILILQNTYPDAPNMAKMMVEEGILKPEEIYNPHAGTGTDSSQGNMVGDTHSFDDVNVIVDLLRPTYPLILDAKNPLPQIVVTQASDLENPDRYALDALRQDWVSLPIEKRPLVIFYTNGQEPTLYHKNRLYQGFLFCKTLDDLANTVCLAKDLVSCKSKPAFLEPAVLAVAQERLYDNSDLREWEHKTADTYLSLKHLLRLITKREMKSKNPLAYRLSTEQMELEPRDWKVATVVDFGTGEGRIAGMLARLGINVVGMDISQGQLDRIPQRMREEGEGIRHEREHPELSYPALFRLQAEGLLPPGFSIIEDDVQAQNHYIPVKGDFHHAFGTLNDLVNRLKYESSFDIKKFLNVPEWQEDALADPEDNFSVAGFDMALFNWNTFCELGSMDNIKSVLHQIMNILDRGGQLVIEIPDRTVGPYAKSQQRYSQAHPGEPFGTIRDTTSVKEGVSTTIHEHEEEDTPRYFPDRNELLLLLQAVGFEIDPAEDVKSYLIVNEDPVTHEKHLQVKELFMVARKPVN